jgi:uncharacterized damage-inducible protein DinB
MRTIEKPKEGEYAPYTVVYYRLLPDDGLVLQHMLDEMESVRALILPLSDEEATTPWAPGEWTIKEILAHIVDDERIYAYRALRFARNDQTLRPGFDQDLYAQHSGANARKLEDILEEWALVRKATVALFDSFEEEAFDRWGVMAEHRTSVRALAYHIAGHGALHIESIKQNYGVKATAKEASRGTRLRDDSSPHS